MDGKRLRELRIKNRLTQEELGKIIHVTKVSISGYESGDRTPDTENLSKLADYFDVSTDYLLGRTDKPKSDIGDDTTLKTFFMNRIATEFPDIDLMFKDMESLTAEEMEEVYEYIKFKKSQKKGDN